MAAYDRGPGRRLELAAAVAEATVGVGERPFVDLE
jgi:hypothetical protein